MLQNLRGRLAYTPQTIYASDDDILSKLSTILRKLGQGDSVSTLSILHASLDNIAAARKIDPQTVSDMLAETVNPPFSQPLNNVNETISTARPNSGYTRDPKTNSPSPTLTQVSRIPRLIKSSLHSGARIPSDIWQGTPFGSNRESDNVYFRDIRDFLVRLLPPNADPELINTHLTSERLTPDHKSTSTRFSAIFDYLVSKGFLKKDGDSSLVFDFNSGRNIVFLKENASQNDDRDGLVKVVKTVFQSLEKGQRFKLSNSQYSDLTDTVLECVLNVIDKMQEINPLSFNVDPKTTFFAKGYTFPKTAWDKPGINELLMLDPSKAVAEGKTVIFTDAIQDETLSMKLASTAAPRVIYNSFVESLHNDFQSEKGKLDTFKLLGLLFENIAMNEPDSVEQNKKITAIMDYLVSQEMNGGRVIDKFFSVLGKITPPFLARRLLASLKLYFQSSQGAVFTEKGRTFFANQLKDFNRTIAMQHVPSDQLFRSLEKNASNGNYFLNQLLYEGEVGIKAVSKFNRDYNRSFIDDTQHYLDKYLDPNDKSINNFDAFLNEVIFHVRVQG